ncbi:MAG: RES family NAD+ phosphorylase, partial [Acidiferrobacterales bacterium]
ITKHFTISRRVDECAQTAGIRPSKIVKSVKEMYANLLDPKWRLRPMQYDVPSNSQIFGEVICEAGIQGIIYPSTKASGECLAVFPSNLVVPDAYIEVVPPVPDELKLTRLDWTTWRELIDE